MATLQYFTDFDARIRAVMTAAGYIVSGANKNIDIKASLLRNKSDAAISRPGITYDVRDVGRTVATGTNKRLGNDYPIFQINVFQPGNTPTPGWMMVDAIENFYNGFTGYLNPAGTGTLVSKSEYHLIHGPRALDESGLWQWTIDLRLTIT